MFSIRPTLIAAVAVCGLLVATASSVAAADGDVTGMITLSGKPLTAGKIILYRDNGQFVGSKVKDGKFTIDRIPSGPMKVSIEGKGVPAKYTSEDSSGLAVQVTEGKNVFEFMLE